MSYTINSTKTENDTIVTNVTFTFVDQTKITLDVVHFMPKDKDEVLLNVLSREETEQRKYDATTTNDEIKIKLDEEVVGKICIKNIDGIIEIKPIEIKPKK